LVAAREPRIQRQSEAVGGSGQLNACHGRRQGGKLLRLCGFRARGSADRGQQAIADDAAQAGIDVLVGTDNRVNLSKFDDASNAAYRAAHGKGVAASNVTPFADGSSFSVALNPPHRRHDVVATARYVRPGQRISEAMGESRIARLSGDE
jgi:hypothetical protein